MRALLLAGEIESPANDHLEDQMIGSMRNAHA
jgi:hypothetical protein